MLRYFLRRLLLASGTLLIVSLLVFIGCEILPGDAAVVALGEFATPEAIATLREQLGLNEPSALRYFQWLWAFLQGDWGVSTMTRFPVTQLLGERLANTAILASATAIIAFPLAVLLGLVMAMNPHGWFDRIASMIVLVFAAMPEFLIGTALVLVISVHLHWLPATAATQFNTLEDVARTLALPILTLTMVVLAQIARMTRTMVVNISETPFIEMAELKGLSRTRITFYHALINVTGPIANIVGLNMAYLISGVVVVETIFAYPGLGRFMIDAVSARDMPVVQACAMVFCIAYTALMAVSDLFAAFFNPRLRTGLLES
jgi:peptide/nickel transport system permease protein